MSSRTDMHVVGNQDDDSSSAGHEDEVLYSEIVGGLVDEEDGYEDQDESMDESMGEEEGDTVEDVMGLTGKTALEVPVRDFSKLYVSGEMEGEGKKEVEEKRKAVERRLVEERVAKEKRELLEIVEDIYVEESENEVCSSANIVGFELLFDLGSTNIFEDISTPWARTNACQPFRHSSSPSVRRYSAPIISIHRISASRASSRRHASCKTLGLHSKRHHRYTIRPDTQVLQDPQEQRELAN